MMNGTQTTRFKPDSLNWILIILCCLLLGQLIFVTQQPPKVKPCNCDYIFNLRKDQLSDSIHDIYMERLFIRDDSIKFLNYKVETYRKILNLK